jgi:DNA-binding CsgD family transcriptional regulator
MHTDIVLESAGPAPSMAAPVDDAARAQVVDALHSIIQCAEDEPLYLNECGTGVSVVLEHKSVRCVLVIDARSPRRGLSPRELEVARLVSEGATNRSIARTLEISLWTVSTYVRRIFAKLDVGSRAEMVAQLYALPQAGPVRARAGEAVQSPTLARPEDLARAGLSISLGPADA